jgi:CrcB protein
MKLLMWAMVGGALGSGARHAVNVGFGRWVGTGGFPWWTLSVNVVGCCLMGVLVEVLAQKFSGSQEMRTFFATGVLGGFTTFSAFSLDFAQLLEQGYLARAALYFGATILLAFLGFFLGAGFTKLLVS